jgi:drug/metabolite transporter (DMT)-like permease
MRKSATPPERLGRGLKTIYSQPKGPMSDVRISLQVIAGYVAIFASAFCFYLSTVVIRWSQPVVTLDPAFFVFTRFLLGFILVCLLLGLRRRRPQPRRYGLLIGRTLANCIAVYCFYKAVEVTSVAEANILNMTYPVFVTLLAWFMMKTQRDPYAIAIVIVAFGGIWLIVAPTPLALSYANLWGLASGTCAAFAIVFLNLSRRYHDTETILFYMFGLGTLLIYAAFAKHIFVPNRQEAYYLVLCGGFGIGGQYLLTLGFRYVTAVEGSIISSTRILLAAMLGPVIAGDHGLQLAGWLGALMIFGANVALTARKAQRGDFGTGVG